MTRKATATTAILFTLLAASAAAFSACAGDNGPDDPDAITIGLDEVAVGADEPVHIRSMHSLTGASALGPTLRHSVEMAADDFGLVHGHEIALGGAIDSKCTGEGGFAAAEQVIGDDRVVGVIGTSCSGAAVEASPVLSLANIVMISPSNTSPALTSDLAGNPNSSHFAGYFRVSNNDLYQAQAIAAFAYGELRLRRMAAVDDGDAYTAALVNAFDHAFRRLGGEVVATATIQKGASDMTPVLARFAESAPDGLFFPLFQADAAVFALQAREFNGLEGATLISGAASLVSAFLATPQSEGVYFAGPEPAPASNVNSATGKSTAEALADYERRVGTAPATPYWAHAYDATTLLLAAIEHAAVQDDGNFLTRALGRAEEGRLLITRSEVREAVRQVSEDFNGLTGRLHCDEFGDCAQGIQNIYHHTDLTNTDPALLPVVYRFEPSRGVLSTPQASPSEGV